MALYYLSPIATVLQYFTNAGVPLSGGKINTYLAGSNTPQATYTDNTGGTPNSNPIILDSSGRLQSVSIWQKAGIALKVIITDSNGVQVGNTIDQISGIDDPTAFQTTYYGGTDSGAANAYVLSFTAPFTAYFNGLLINFIAANANTGPSTINVNGLGAVNILNGDASTLSNGEIQAGAMTSILFVGSGFVLMNPAYQSVFTSGSFSATPFGLTVNTPANITWAKSGKIVVLNIPSFGGTSNSTSFGVSGLPSNLQIGVGKPTAQMFGINAQDNGAGTTYAAGDAFISAASGNINFEFKGGSWTAANTKSMAGFMFPYFVSGNFT